MNDLNHDNTNNSFWDIETPSGQLAESYLCAMLEQDRFEASRIILNAAEKGTSVKDIYMEVLEPVQQKLGWLWQKNKINVAQEHYCTAVTQLVMSQLFPIIARSPKTGKSMIAACVPGELHEIGVQMVADFFEMEGWRTYYLGAITPVDSLIDMVLDKSVSMIAISATITYNLPAAIDMIKTIRASEAGSVKILVGGRLFNVAPDIWKQTSADSYAENASSAVSTAATLSA